VNADWLGAPSLQVKNNLRLKMLKKLRTASLDSKFTGSYKKMYT